MWVSRDRFERLERKVQRVDRLEEKVESINRRLRATDIRLAAIRRALRASVRERPGEQASVESELKETERRIEEVAQEEQWARGELYVAAEWLE